jgi:hypothetical protein
MAEASWPSPNHGSPARSVTDTEYVRLAPWNSDGVFASASDVVYANSSGMQVHVRAGKYAIVRGHAWTSGTAEYNLTIAANSSGSTRVDTVVLRLDRSTWDVTAAVRQGTPGSGAPALQRDTGDTGLWEIPLADITVLNGASSIAAGNVTSRTLLQSAGIRPCNAIADIQATLAAGDLVYELTTGRWIAWTGSAGIVLYQDTGYQTLTIIGNWTAGSYTPQCRLRNGWVYLRGSVNRTINTLQSTDTNSPISTIPAAFRPAGTHNFVSCTSAIGLLRLQVAYDTGALAIVDLASDIPVGRVAYLDTGWIAG